MMMEIVNFQIFEVMMNDLLDRAECGESDAQYLVGCMYNEGDGVEKDTL
jgi:TPR repeat protein